MTSKVAIVKLSENNAQPFNQAVNLIGGIDDLNTVERPVVIKVGVFSHRAGNHTSVDLVNAIAKRFNKAPKIFIAESDNYQGKALERLQIWRELFTDRVVPFDLSDNREIKPVKLADIEMHLSKILFKPNVLVSTHILRSFQRGSILKNLFGCIPTTKKAKFHKNEIFYPLLADIYEAVGGIDLAVLDGTYFWRGAGSARIRMDTLLVGRDAVAVEAVGATLAGLNPEKTPIIQEFVKRGLGEGDLSKIEIVGIPLEDLKPKFSSAAKELPQVAAAKILGKVDPKKDTVVSLASTSKYSKTRVVKALRYLGHTVHKDGTFD